MKEKKQSNPQSRRSKWLHLRLSETEYALLQQQFKSTLERSLSAYARKVFLHKPMIGGTRDLALDDLVKELIILLKDLNGVANNFNQITHKLHTLHHIPEFRGWILRYDKDKEKLMISIEEIKVFIRHNSQLWFRG